MRINIYLSADVKRHDEWNEELSTALKDLLLTNVIKFTDDQDPSIALEVKKPERLTLCPDCSQYTVRAKGLQEGGGVVCTNPECDYWFCY